MSKKHKNNDHKQELEHHHHHDHEGGCCHHEHEHEHDDLEMCEEFDFDMNGPTDDMVMEMTHVLMDSIGHLTEVCVEAELASGNKLKTQDVLKIYDQVTEKVMENIHKVH